MESNNRSLTLSLILTKLLMAAVILMDIAAFRIVRIYDDYKVIPLGLPSILSELLVTLYAASVPALAAMAVLNKLLLNIKKGIVFDIANVKILRLISYMCFAEGLIFFAFGLYRPLSFAISAAAVFFGLIMRVLKNVFAAAVSIKEESDLTI